MSASYQKADCSPAKRTGRADRAALTHTGAIG